VVPVQWLWCRRCMLHSRPLQRLPVCDRLPSKDAVYRIVDFFSKNVDYIDEMIAAI
jgi:hypothetical protein